MTKYCPSCAEEVVSNSGSEGCDYLIIEEFPELVLPAPSMQSKWQKNDWNAKKILIAELAKVGMVIQQFRIVSAFPHHAPEDGMPNEGCYAFGLQQVIDEIMSKKGVIVLGNNLCKTFTGYSLKQVQGLSGVESQYIPDLDVPRAFLPTFRSIMVTKSPGVGEFRIGLERFVAQLSLE